MNIGNKLKSLRVEKRFEPLDMALKLGISETTYRRYERNEASPDLNMIEKIATILDKNVLELIPNEFVSQVNTFKKDGVGLAYHYSVNQLSEKVIELYDKRLEEKDAIIKDKDLLINELKSIIAVLKQK
jgi:transcriptional regulator with XRE-family HTH domain